MVRIQQSAILHLCPLTPIHRLVETSRSDICSL